MNAQTSHPVKAETIEIHYSNNGATTKVHAAGCQHRAQSKSAPQDRLAFLADLAVYADDYYDVAPCAR